MTASFGLGDAGLTVLVTMLRIHGVAADPDQLRHRYGGSAFGVLEILRCAKELGLRARIRKTNWTRLAKTPLPAIATLRDGGFLLLGRISGDGGKILVQEPASSKPEVRTREEFERLWDGRL